jgi:hypothetical protein
VTGLCTAGSTAQVDRTRRKRWDLGARSPGNNGNGATRLHANHCARLPGGHISLRPPS